MKFYSDDELNQAVSGITQGESYVAGIREKESRDGDCCLVFLFSDNKEINDLTIYYLPLFGKINGVSEFLIISPYDELEADIRQNSRCDCRFLLCSNKDMANVCRYYSTFREYEPDYVKTGVIINGSPFPEDNRLYRIMGYNGITVKEYVAFSVMRFSRMPEDGEVKEAITDKNPVCGLKIDNDDSYDLESVVQEIQAGRKIYDRIRENHPDEMIYLLPYPGTGDIYLLGMYIKDRMEYDKVDKGVLVVSAKSCEKLYSLMKTDAGISEVVILDGRKEAVKLLRFAKLIGYEKLKVLMINDSFDLIDIGKLRGFKKLDFNTLFLRTVFLTDKKRQRVRFQKNNADYLFREYSLKREKTVILSPYTKSMMPIKMAFWEKLAKSLFEKEYDVITNAAVNENAINGTVGVCIPYDRLIDFLDKSFAFIGMRSGLCDVVSGSAIKKVILYHPHIEPNTTSSIGFFGLGNMEIGQEPLYEIVTDGEGEEIIERITGIIDG